MKTHPTSSLPGTGTRIEPSLQSNKSASSGSVASSLPSAPVGGGRGGKARHWQNVTSGEVTFVNDERLTLEFSLSDMIQYVTFPDQYNITFPEYLKSIFPDMDFVPILVH